jgi:8-oxo-dGTP pyrophosphatase MutT (NUDIX family)
MTYGNFEPTLPTPPGVHGAPAATYSLVIVRPHGGFACGAAFVLAQLPASDLPFGYRATFIWRRPNEPFEVRWSPELPRIRKPRPRRKFVAAYQAARREFFEEVGAVVGGMILVVDTDLKTVAHTTSSCRRRSI